VCVGKNITQVESNISKKDNGKKSINWNAIAAFLTVVGLFFAGVGLFKTSTQIGYARKLAGSELMREYYNSIQQFNDIQVKLVKNGEWRADISSGPKTKEDWFRLQRYMGFLEQIYYWNRDGIMGLDRIDNGYSHRFKAIASHPKIRERLLKQEDFRWKYFISILCELTEKPVFKGISYSPPFNEAICKKD